MKIIKTNRSINKVLYLVLGIYFIMIFLFIFAGKNFSDYFSIVFSMNKENMRYFLSTIGNNGDLGVFSFLFVLDYIFFILLGCFFYLKLKYQAKCLNGKFRRIISTMAYLGPLSILADGIETSILQYMIHHYKNFPGYLVNIQTLFTFLALSIDLVAIFWIVFISVKIKFNIKFSRM
jgi:hypothetical protein